MAKIFLRRNWNKYKRLGLRNKKKQVWRKPKGIHNKMRENRRGYSAIVRIGYRKGRKNRGRIEGFIPVVVRNLSDLSNVGNDNIVIIGKVGKKKRQIILDKIKELNAHSIGHRS
ncbi:hypothetical protein HYV49_01605 [Candidatus Pacearchaeota archaeon]|nr:hypothetical protein [Candidatus Pacearchaeota archaeon]